MGRQCAVASSGGGRTRLWVRLVCVAVLGLGGVFGCTRDNPDFIDEGDGEVRPDLATPDRGPRDGRDPLDPDDGAAPEPLLDLGVEAGPDGEPDGEPDTGPAPPTDDDGDGVSTPDDCDDADPAIFPGAPERCDGRDGDCDGAIDEGIAGLGAPCVAGEGVCRIEGRQICGPDGGLRCDAVAAEPGEEQCNGLDDDCDGGVDEMVLDCCEPGEVRPCGSAEGACASGRQTCGPDEVFGPCEGAVGPRPEACDGVDRDCDGMVDEGYAIGAPCTVGVGLCAVDGETQCEGGDVACDARPGLPLDERCNGLDDDCDGVADEPFADLGRPCAVGQGGCARQGTIVCGPDGITCDVMPGMPSDEICNGIDDDCDGMPDEGAGGGMPCSEGEGACRRDGVTVCDARGMLTCGAVPGMPVAERCNSVDDDCDGSIDEAWPELGADCVVMAGGCMADGTRACAADGASLRCEAPPIEGAVEVCNGIDDDCDGPVDEDFAVGDACQAGLGACAVEGVVVCDGEAAARCEGMPGMPSDEACNGIDDDCDGASDEDFGVGDVCTVGLGACAAEGRVQCGDAGPFCRGAPLPPGEERCNGADDDCDGQPDEGVTNACGGCGPVPDETCDGSDEDCDGQVDEGTGVCVVHLGAIDAPEGALAFGSALAAAGDLDGDGVADVLVGAPDGEAGLAAALAGGSLRVLWTVADIPRFGTDVAAGDIDGDGVRELFVGSPGEPAGAVVQFDATGDEIRRIPGADDVRAGRQIIVADGAPWLVMGDRDARPTVFGPAGALRVVNLVDGLEGITLEGEAGGAMGARLHLAPDVGADGLPDIVTTTEDFIDRAVVRFVDPPLDQRTALLNPGFSNGSFGEGAAFGRLLADEPTIAAYGAPLANARQTGGVYLFDVDELPVGGLLSNAGARARQGHRLAVLPRPDEAQDALILSADAQPELRVWSLVRSPDGRPAIADTRVVPAGDAGASLGRSMVLGALGPDGTRRLFVGEPDAAGGGRVHVFSAR